MILFLQRFLQLLRLFLHFFKNAACILPIKADAGCFASELKAFQRCGQGAGDAVQQRDFLRGAVSSPRISFVVAGASLFGLDLLPVSQYLGGILRARLSENMGMSPDHLVMNFANHFGYGEAALFAGNLGMKYNLQKQIAHFFRELGVVPAFEGFQNFVGFLDEVGSHRLMCLLAVPGASIWGPQSGLDAHELFKPLAWRQLFLLRRFVLVALFFCSLELLLACGHAFIGYFRSEPSVPLYGATAALTTMADSVGGSQRLRQATRDKLQAIQFTEESTLSDHKQEEAFRVIDRRPFTAEGELRKEVVEEEEREAKREAAKVPAAAPPPAETPKRLAAFENLVRMLGSNAAMVLGGYADPRTGQPMIDPDAARELIDMLDDLYQCFFQHAALSVKSHSAWFRHIHGCSHARMPLPRLQVE